MTANERPTVRGGGRAWDPKFSQAQGLEPLPQPLWLGELPAPIRNAIFAVLYAQLYAASEPRGARGLFITRPWDSLLRAKHVHFDLKPPDELTTEFWAVNREFKHICFN